MNVFGGADLFTLGMAIDPSNAVRGAAAAEAAINRVGAAGRGVADTLVKALIPAGGSFEGVGVKALAMAKTIGVAFGAGAVISKFTLETIAAQFAMAQLEARVRSTGGAAGRSVSQLDELSVSLQRVTTFSDESIKGAESLLLTFNKIHGDTFDQATRAALDMATAMGGDVQSAALQLGKALQEPEQGLTALRRSGVSFSDAQQQVIKDLFNSGRQAEAQALILKELQAEFGGAAAAARNTLGGALRGLENAWGDLFEVSGRSSQGIVRAINAMAEALPHVRSAFDTFFTDFEVWTVKSASVWHRFLDTVHRRDTSWIDQWKKDQLDAINGIAARAKFQPFGPATPSALEPPGPDAQKKISDIRGETAELNALNAAFAQSDLTLAKIKIHYEAMNRLRAETTGRTESETRALTEVIHEWERASIIAAENADRMKRFGDVASMSLDNLKPQLTATSRLMQDIAKLGDEVAGIHVSAAAITPPKLTDRQRLFHDFERGLQDDISHAISDGFRNGTASVQGFADVTYRIFTDLAARLAALRVSQKLFNEDDVRALRDGNLSALSGRAKVALGVGVGAASLYAAYQSGSAGGGALSGAAGGAAIGSMIAPGIGTAIGAVVGGLAGLTAGLLGGGKAARERAEAEHELQVALAANIAQIKQQLGIISQLDGSLAQSHQQFEALRKQTEDALAGRKNEAERNRTLAELNALEAQRAAQLRDEVAYLKKTTEEDLRVRLLRAQGDDVGADAMAFALGQEREYAKALRDHADATTLAFTAETLAAEAAKREADHAAEVAKAAADKARSQQDARDSDQLRLLRATGHTDEAEALALQLEQEKRLRDYQTAGYDAATLAARALADAAETAALAAQQAERRTSDWLNNIQQQGEIFGLSPDDQFAGETAAFGFGGKSRADVAALFKKFDPTAPLTEAEKIFNDHVTQWIRDFDRLHPMASPAGAGFVGTDSYRQSTIGTVTGISDSQALGLLGYAQTQVNLLSAIEEHTRRMSVLGGSPNGATVAPNGNGSVTLHLTVQVNVDRLQQISDAIGDPTFEAAVDRALGRGLTRTRAAGGAPRT